MNTTQTIRTIEEDFESGAGPFSDVAFPEERLLSTMAERVADGEIESLSMEDRLALVSAFGTFDYNRDANQLVDNLLELHKRNPRWFNARHVVHEGNEEILEGLFKDIGFRYGQRDAHAWFVNCEIVTNRYHGKWSELVLDTGCDAPTLVERLSDDDFLCLKGVKIAPMYARIIDEFVTELDNVWDLDIPVDTHIRRLSKDLFQMPEASDDRIREEWRGLAIETDISRQIVDGALWHIGNKWDDWGEDYWEEVQ